MSVEKKLASLVWSWWLSHKSDSVGDRNVYDNEPDFVELAGSLLNDIEKSQLYTQFLDSL